MSFIRPIRAYPKYGLDCVQVDVPLTVVNGSRGDVGHTFIYDTGCEITTVGEDVATKLGLPAGGRPVGMTSTTGSGTGRLVNVRFRFPKTIDGGPGHEADSTWVVIPDRTDLAILGFQEVHRHFWVRSYEFDLYFMRW